MALLSGLKTDFRCHGRASDFQPTVWHQGRSTDSSCQQQVCSVRKSQDMIYGPAKQRCVLCVTHSCSPMHQKEPSFEKDLKNTANRKMLMKNRITWMTAESWLSGGSWRARLSKRAVLHLERTGLAVFLVHPHRASRDSPSGDHHDFHSIPSFHPCVAHFLMAGAGEITTVAGETLAAPTVERDGANTAAAGHRQVAAPGGRASDIAPASGAQPSGMPSSSAPPTSADDGASESDPEDGAGDGHNSYCCTVCSYHARSEKETGHKTQRCSAVSEECTSSPAAPSEIKTESSSRAGRTAKQKCTAKSFEVIGRRLWWSNRSVGQSGCQKQRQFLLVASVYSWLRVPNICIAVVCVALRVPAHAPWLARRSLVHRVTRMTCHAPVRTGGAVGAGWDLD